MGGTPKRMEQFAYTIMAEIGHKLPCGTTLQDISQFSYRYSMYKVGPVLCISVSIYKIQNREVKEPLQLTADRKQGRFLAFLTRAKCAIGRLHSIFLSSRPKFGSGGLILPCLRKHVKQLVLHLIDFSLFMSDCRPIGL